MSNFVKNKGALVIFGKIGYDRTTKDFNLMKQAKIFSKP